MSYVPFIETDRFKQIADRVEIERQREIRSHYGDWEELYAKQFGIDVNPAVVSTLLYELRLYYDAYKEWRELAEKLQDR